MSLSSRPAPVLVVCAALAAVGVLLGVAQAWWPLAIYVAAVAPLLHLVLYPYRTCPRCEGGRTWSPGRRAYSRDCRRCEGSGQLPRWGGLGLSLRGSLGIESDD